MSDERDPLGILGKTLEEKYRIESLAGIGGFSVVYRAEQIVWNEPVAIKFFTMLEDAKPELREKLLQDFILEGKLMTQLSSRSAAIVQARDMGKLKLDDGDDWIPYMVLEWLDGSALDRVISSERRANLPPRTLAEAMTLLEPAAVALDIAHRGNVAHRDLKPANLIITGDPRDPETGLKVLDFGIAKVMEGQVELADQLQLTGQHITAFTPNYGAPEQFSRNFGATGPWTDVFAMALILIELLRGTRVLDGESFFELGVASCDDDRRPTPRTLGLEVSDEVEAVFTKALAVNPKRRHPNMAAFWRELHHSAFPDADTWSPRTNKPSLRNPQTEVPASQIVITPSDPKGIGSAHPDTVSAVTFAGHANKSRKPLLWAAGSVAAASIAVLVVAISTRSGDATGTGTPTPPPSVDAATPRPASTPAAVVTTSSREPVATSVPIPEPSTSASTPVPAPRAGVPPTGPKTAPPSRDPDPKTPPQPPPPGGDPWDPSSFGGRR